MGTNKPDGGRARAEPENSHPEASRKQGNLSAKASTRCDQNIRTKKEVDQLEMEEGSHAV